MSSVSSPVLHSTHMTWCCSIHLYMWGESSNYGFPLLAFKNYTRVRAHAKCIHSLEPIVWAASKLHTGIWLQKGLHWFEALERVRWHRLSICFHTYQQNLFSVFHPTVLCKLATMSLTSISNKKLRCTGPLWSLRCHQKSSGKIRTGRKWNISVYMFLRHCIVHKYSGLRRICRKNNL